MAEQAGEAIETRQRWLSGHLYRRTAWHQLGGTGDLLGLVTLHLVYANALKAAGRAKSVNATDRSKDAAHDSWLTALWVLQEVKGAFEKHYKLCVICFGDDHERTKNAKLVMNK